MPLLEKQPTSVLFWRLAIALAALLLYLPTLGFEFTMDDVPRVERNPLVLAPVDGPLSLLSPFTHPTVPGDLYRPVVDTTFRLTSTLISSAPSVAHAINIGLHVVVSLLVFQLFLSLFSSMTVAGAGALVFAIHPIHVGAISNISGRYELCAALFGLLGCLLSIAWQQATRPRAFIYAVASGVALLLAALSKESGLVFVGLILLTAIASSNKVNATRRFLVLAVCLIIAAGIALGLRAAVLGDRFLIPPASSFQPINPLWHLPFLDRVVPGVVLLGYYLLFVVWPFDLRIDYSMTQADFNYFIYGRFGTVALLALIVVMSFCWLMRRRISPFFPLWFLVGLALTCNILTPIGTLMAERLCYVPSIGAIGLLTAGLAVALKRAPKGLQFVGTCGWVGTLAVLASVRVPAWRDNGVLFRRIAELAPSSPRAQLNLGLRLFLVENNLDEGELHLLRSLRLRPDSWPAMTYLFEIALQKEQLGKAKHYAEKILQLKPNHVRANKFLKALHNAETPEK